MFLYVLYLLSFYPIYNFYLKISEIENRHIASILPKVEIWKIESK